MVRLVTLLLLFAPAAAAESYEAGTYGVLLRQCYEEAATEAKLQCVGAASEACMAEEEGGQTTLGISLCTAGETEVWDGYLNAEYKTTMAAMRAMDDDERVYFPEFANRATALRDAQRAWIPFRDAECGLDYALWGSGSMRNIAGASCALDLTARRTIRLIELREMMQ